jgi:hypothetical protein
MKTSRKNFCSEEKKQKTFIYSTAAMKNCLAREAGEGRHRPNEPWTPSTSRVEPASPLRPWPRSRDQRRHKSLLVLFFRKEHSSFLGLPQ